MSRAMAEMVAIVVIMVRFWHRSMVHFVPRCVFVGRNIARFGYRFHAAKEHYADKQMQQHVAHSAI